MSSLMSESSSIAESEVETSRDFDTTQLQTIPERNEDEMIEVINNPNSTNSGDPANKEEVTRL